MFVKEGKVEVRVIPGRVAKDDDVFYNPRMKLNRDITVLVGRAFQRNVSRELIYGDFFSATGIRGLRFLKEVPGIKKVLFNDLNPKALELIKKNIKGVSKDLYEIHKEDAGVLMHKSRFLIDFVDIDPFGSPAFYLEAGARAVSNKGLIAITATDTAPLCGTYPKTCLRRYHSLPLREDIKHEVGLRILMKELAYALSKFDKGMVPLLSYSFEHYFRIFAKIDKRKESANKSVIENTGYLLFCRKCGYREYVSDSVKICKHCKEDVGIYGPLWIGALGDVLFLGNMLKDSYTNEFKDSKNLIELLKEEYSNAGYYYNVHYLGRILKRTVKKMKVIENNLKDRSYSFSRTHFDPRMIKTDAPFKELVELI